MFNQWVTIVICSCAKNFSVVLRLTWHDQEKCRVESSTNIPYKDRCLFLVKMRVTITSATFKQLNSDMMVSNLSENFIVTDSDPKWEKFLRNEESYAELGINLLYYLMLHYLFWLFHNFLCKAPFQERISHLFYINFMNFHLLILLLWRGSLCFTLFTSSLPFLWKKRKELYDYFASPGFELKINALFMVFMNSMKLQFSTFNACGILWVVDWAFQCSKFILRI